MSLIVRLYRLSFQYLRRQKVGKRLYVGNLPYDVTEDQLQTLLAPLGHVAEARLIVDRVSGQSKGFGFVEMSTEEEAQAAIQKLNGTRVGARQIVVNEAKPMENRRPVGAARGGMGNRW
jgi:RNA recognition motif-containing protein